MISLPANKNGPIRASPLPKEFRLHQPKGLLARIFILNFTFTQKHAPSGLSLQSQIVLSLVAGFQSH